MIDKQVTPHRIRTVCTLAWLLLSVSLGSEAGGDSPAPAPDTRPPAVEEPTAAAPSRRPPRAATRAVLDPETGELTSRTVEIEWRQASPELREKLSRRSDDLVEEPLPGGGFMVDLRGRFHTFLVAKLETDGELRTHCVRAATAKSEPASDADRASQLSTADAAGASAPDAGRHGGVGGKDG